MTLALTWRDAGHGSNGRRTLDGSREISFTIVSMTLSLVAVFIPVLFMGGIVGRLLREFAVTISTAILASAFISLTLTPMLCSRFLKHESHGRHGRLYNLSERFFDWMLHSYDRTLKVVLNYRLTTIGVSFVLLVVTAFLFKEVPKGFLPTEDKGNFAVSVQLPDAASLQRTAGVVTRVNEILHSEPAMANVVLSVVAGLLALWLGMSTVSR